jgi:hypothetical protein
MSPFDPKRTLRKSSSLKSTRWPGFKISQPEIEKIGLRMTVVW